MDEESGGFAGVAWLAEHGRIAKGRTDYVIIPEPLNVDRICIGHRGVYWFEVTTRGRIAHGSMPFLGVSAIDGMGRMLEAVREELMPRARVAHDGRAGRAAGRAPRDDQRQRHRRRPAVDGIQTPCVADRCRAVFDRRFLLEEGFDATQAGDRRPRGARGPADAAACDYDLRDLMVVHPMRTPDGSPLDRRRSTTRSCACSTGRPRLVASPGTYDHKHVARIAGVPHCVAYGPGELELAHQPDEWCRIDDLVNATKVIALATLDLMGVHAA